MDIEKLTEQFDFVLLYTAIAFVGVLLLVGAAVYFFKRDKFADFKKYALGAAVGMAVVAVVAMSYLVSLDTEFENNGKNMLFWPVMAEIIIVIAGAAAMLICGLFSKKAVKVAGAVTAVGALAGFIAIMVEMAKYFETVKADYDANTTGLIVSGIVFMAIVVVIYMLGNKQSISDTRSIVYGAIAIALSFALSYIKFFQMPQGGSLTLASLLPLMIYCCMFGTRRGVIVCLIYGALQALQDPYIIHPMQFLLDYPLAFGMIGISGIFVEKGFVKKYPVVGFVLGGVLAVCLRYACHVCSGVFAFSVWADLDKYATVTLYSMAYNSFAFVDMVIALAAGALMFMSQSFAKQFEKSRSAGSKKAIEYVDDDEPFEAQNTAAEVQSEEDNQDGAETSAAESAEDRAENCQCDEPQSDEAGKDE